MTPKDKAQEIYEHFDYDKWNSIICVNEIIKTNPVEWVTSDDYTGFESRLEYWQQVKEELQKM